jgi:hypothetical protein
MGRVAGRGGARTTGCGLRDQRRRPGARIRLLWGTGKIRCTEGSLCPRSVQWAVTATTPIACRACPCRQRGRHHFASGQRSRIGCETRSGPCCSPKPLSVLRHLPSRGWVPADVSRAAKKGCGPDPFLKGRPFETSRAAAEAVQRVPARRAPEATPTPKTRLNGYGWGHAGTGGVYAVKPCAGWLIVPMRPRRRAVRPTSRLDALFPKEIFTAGATEDSNRPLG